MPEPLASRDESSCVVHPDLYSFIALEIGASVPDVRKAFASEHFDVDAMVDRVCGDSLRRAEFTLAEPIGREDDAVLLADNVVLTPRYLQLLFARQVKHPHLPIGPIVLHPKEQTILHYRNKALGHLSSLVEAAREGQGTAPAHFYKNLRSSPHTQVVFGLIDEISSQLLAAPGHLPAIVQALTRGANQSLLSRSIDAAVVSMSVLLSYHEFPAPDTRDCELKHLGAAAVLQDFSVLADTSPNTPEHAEEHAEESAHIAQALGMDGRVATLIRRHHLLFDASGQPALLVRDDIDHLDRTLIAVNVFLGMVAAGADIFEIVKQLNHLAQGQILDATVVGTLARWCLPEVKAYVLEHANRIRSKCPFPGASPFVWPVTGDKIPTVFLCGEQRCEHETPQISDVARDVNVTFDGQDISIVPKGVYFTCPLLTQSLLRLYRSMQERSVARKR